MPDELADRPKRMTISQVLDRMLTRQVGASTSVTLARNAKGETQIEVKVAADGDQIVTPKEAYAEARRLYDNACAAYPTASGHVRTDGDAGKGSPAGAGGAT